MAKKEVWRGLEGRNLASKGHFLEPMSVVILLLMKLSRWAELNINLFHLSQTRRLKLSNERHSTTATTQNHGKGFNKIIKGKQDVKKKCISYAS